MRPIISRKFLTAAAVAGIVSLTGGFATAADTVGRTGDGPGATSGGHHQDSGRLTEDLCGLGDAVVAALDQLCGPAHQAEADGPDGSGDEYGHGHPGHPTPTPTAPTVAPTKPGEPSPSPTHPTPTATHPTPTHPTPTHSTPTHPTPTHPTPTHSTPTHPTPTYPTPTHSTPTHPTPTSTHPTSPSTNPTTPGEEPTSTPTPTSTHPGHPQLPDTGSEPLLVGAGALSVALILGGSVLYFRKGRALHRH